MTPGLTINGMSDHGPPDPPYTYTVPVRSVVDEQCDRDQSLFETLTLRCAECQRHGAAKDGAWHHVSGVCYCDACWNAEAHS